MGFKLLHSMRTWVLVSLALSLMISAAVIIGMGFYFSNVLGGMDDDIAEADVVRSVHKLRNLIDKFHAGLNEFTATDEGSAAMEAFAEGDASLWLTWLSSTVARSLAARGTDEIVNVNLYAFYSANCTHLYSKRGTAVPAHSWFANRSSCEAMGWNYEGVVSLSGITPYVVVMRPFHYVTGTNTTRIAGALLMGASIEQTLTYLANATTGSCIALWNTTTSDKMPSDVSSAYSKLVAGLLPSSELGSFNGSIVQKKISRSHAAQASNRVCEEAYKSVSSHSASYFLMDSGLPGTYPGPVYRIDVPRTRENAGWRAFIVAMCILLGLLVAASIVGYLIVEIWVLRRVEQIVSSMRGNKKLNDLLNKPLELLDGSKPVQVDECHHMEVASEESSDTTISGKDEIGALGFRMRRMIDGLRSRFIKTNNLLIETRHRSALRATARAMVPQLCTMTQGTLPGIAHDKACTARKPSDLDLDCILQNPLAVECLKAFCVTSDTQENLQFVVDTAHFMDVVEMSRVALSRGDYACDPKGVAQSIKSIYVTEDAPAMLNLSAGVRKAIIDNCSKADTPLFVSANNEIMHLISSDILPRFYRSNYFTAACMLMFIEQYGTSAPSGSGALLNKIARASYVSQQSPLAPLFASFGFSSVHSSGAI